MRIFLTGGSGFVGRAFAAAMAGRHEIVGLSRSKTSDDILETNGARPVKGDLGTVEAKDLLGHDVVVHCAAYVEQWGPWSTYWAVNVEGTRRLLEAAREAGVKRFVHIGTEAALLRGQHLRGVDETYPLALNSPFPYSRTKAHAEKLVREASDPDGGFETIVLRPRLVWGAGDTTLLPALKHMADTGSFVWISGGTARTSTTHIANLVHAMERALSEGRSGEAYFVLDDGGAIPFREMLSRLAMAAGFELNGPDVPGGLVRSLAYVLEKTWRLLGRANAPPITRFAANLLSRDCILIDEKARSELGYAPAMTREMGLAGLANSVR